MPSPEVIQELLRQSFLERQQPPPGQVAVQQIMQGILQGIQLYDMVKGLGAKYGGNIKTTTPGQPDVTPVTPELSLRTGTEFTPRTLPGVQNVFTSLSVPQPGFPPAVPTTPSTPAQNIATRYPGSAEADILKSLQYLPELQQRFATAKGLGNIRPTLLEEKTAAQATQIKNKVAFANSQLQLMEERIKSAKTKSEKENLAPLLNSLSNSLLPTMLLASQGDATIEDQNSLSDLLTRIQLMQGRIQGLPTQSPSKKILAESPAPKSVVKPEKKNESLLEKFKGIFKSPAKIYRNKEEAQKDFFNGDIDREEFIQILKDHATEWNLTE